MSDQPTCLRADLQLIISLVPEGSRVLDLGCGDGSLMAHLRDERGCDVRGIELAPEEIAAAIDAGSLGGTGRPRRRAVGYPDSAFDVVVLSQTLQVIRRPDARAPRDAARWSYEYRVVPELRRTGASAAFLRSRAGCLCRESIPYSWYDTPNIHHTTLKDFRDLCQRLGLEIVREVPLSTDDFGHAKPVTLLPNLFSDTSLAVLKRAGAR